MKQILVIGNDNLDVFKNFIAKVEGNKTKEMVFVANLFSSDIAQETSEYIYLTDGQKNSKHVMSYLDDAGEYNKPIREIRISTLRDAIKHCDDVMNRQMRCDNCYMEHLQLKYWLMELNGVKNGELYDRL